MTTPVRRTLVGIPPLVLPEKCSLQVQVILGAHHEPGLGLN